jgi:type II secretory ATPase GspE/PulE/Tfp pilus assembly ATPase PilB-like protein
LPASTGSSSSISPASKSSRLAVADASALAGTIERTYRVHIEVKQEGDAVELSRLQNVLDSDGTATTIDLVNSVLSRAIAEGASDIHFDPQERERIVRAEIRDEETASIAIQAAMTGHLVLDAAHERCGERDRPAGEHGHRPRGPGHLRQLHRRPTARAKALPPLT